MVANVECTLFENNLLIWGKFLIQENKSRWPDFGHLGALSHYIYQESFWTS